jgi:hypothetical protein
MVMIKCIIITIISPSLLLSSSLLTYLCLQVRVAERKMEREAEIWYDIFIYFF